MRLTPIHPDFASKLRTKVKKVSKNLARNIITGHAKPDSLIVLGNGDPDDQVIAILCHYLDGEKDVAIVKSELTRVNALKNLQLYLKNLGTVETIVVILDQEKDPLDDIFRSAEGILRNENIRYERHDESDRIKKYECVFGSRRFNLIVVVSGLGSLDFTKHNIEEHLVVVATNLGKEVLGGKTDPKDVWRALSYEERLDVLRQLSNQEKLARDFFPQHWKGLEFILRV